LGGGNFLPASYPKPRRLPNGLDRDPQKNVLILKYEKRMPMGGTFLFEIAVQYFLRTQRTLKGEKR